MKFLLLFLFFTLFEVVKSEDTYPSILPHTDLDVLSRTPFVIRNSANFYLQSNSEGELVWTKPEWVTVNNTETNTTTTFFNLCQPSSGFQFLRYNDWSLHYKNLTLLQYSVIYRLPPMQLFCPTVSNVVQDQSCSLHRMYLYTGAVNYDRTKLMVLKEVDDKFTPAILQKTPYQNTWPDTWWTNIQRSSEAEFSFEWKFSFKGYWYQIGLMKNSFHISIDSSVRERYFVTTDFQPQCEITV